MVVAVVAGCGTGSPSSGSASAVPTVAGPGRGADPPLSGEGAAIAPSGTPAGTTTPTPAPVAAVSAAPGFGTVGMAPADPVSITVTRGVIDALTMTGPAGAAVSGSLSPDRRMWTLGQVLGFDAVYTVTGTATGTDGQRVPITGTFGTPTADTMVRDTVYPGDDAVVGVAAPVIVYFGVEPVDRAAVAAHVTVTSEPAVEGAWAWIHHDDGRWGLDYRTKDPGRPVPRFISRPGCSGCSWRPAPTGRRTSPATSASAGTRW